MNVDEFELGVSQENKELGGVHTGDPLAGGGAW